MGGGSFKTKFSLTQNSDRKKSIELMEKKYEF